MGMYAGTFGSGQRRKWFVVPHERGTVGLGGRALRNLVKRIVFETWMAVGQAHRRAAAFSATDSVTIVNLHRVSPETNRFWQPLHPAIFDGLVKFLKEHFEIVTVLESEESRGTRPIAVLSFDDGYHDFLEYAVPILDRHGISANQNVVGSCLEDGLPPWETRLYDFLNFAPPSLLRELRLPGFSRPWPGASAADRASYALALSRLLKHKSRADRAPIWAALECFMARAEPRYTRMMTAREVVEVSKRHEIGCHSWSHDSMGFESDEHFIDDLQRCQSYFDNRLCLPLKVYAFPNGSHRKEEVESLRAAGIRKALLVEERTANRADFALPRRTIYGDSTAEAVARAVGFGKKS